MIKTSLAGGFAGLIAEYWYFKDYWRPPTILTFTIYSIEDFIVGFFLLGISISIYSFTFNKIEIKQEKAMKKIFLFLFLFALSMMIILQPLGYNSMLISPLIFIIYSIIIVIIRKDLLKKAIYSGILFLIIILPIYMLLFNFIAPNYWNKYWVISNTKFGTTCLGNIPCMEVLWYFSWGSFGGICHNFYSGTKVV